MSAFRRPLVLLFSCAVAATAAAPAFAQGTACISDFDPAADYFPAKATVEEAANFSVAYFGSYKVVEVAVPYPGGAPQTYVLVQCGAPVPAAAQVPGAVVVTIPVDRVFAGSGPAMFAALGRLDEVAGVPSGQYLYDQQTRDAIAAGRIVEFSPNFELDLERVVSGRPDLYVTGGTDDPAHARIADAGIPVVSPAPYLEPTALGQAEWVKFIALFFNDEAEAEAQFDDVQARYAEVAARAATVSAPERPLVLAGAAYQGIFYAAGGQSYVAEMIEDAGGRYVFAANTQSGSATMTDLEQVVAQAFDATVWLNISAPSVAAAIASEPRLGGILAARNGNIWQYDLLATPSGALDYFERGALRPDLVLSDLVKIFHPDLMADYEFTFYRRLPAE